MAASAEKIRNLDKVLVGRKLAAALLDLSVGTIDNLVFYKFLRPRSIGGRVLFLRQDLESFALRAHDIKIPPRPRKPKSGTGDGEEFQGAARGQ